MTRTARKSTKKEPFPATSWTKLKESPEKHQAKDKGACKEEEDVKVEKKLLKVNRGELKLTKKTKLKKTGNLVKRLIEKVNKRKAGRRVQFALMDTMPLLADVDDQESGEDGEGGGVPAAPAPLEDLEVSCTQKDTERSNGSLTKIMKKHRKGVSKEQEESTDENIWLLEPSSVEDQAALEGDPGGEGKLKMKKQKQKLESGAGRIKSKEGGGEGGKEQQVKRREVEREEVVDEKTRKKREARRLRRRRNKPCFNCRKPGHFVHECPQKSQAEVCYKCGSGEHASKDCKSKVPPDEYPYATCFVCGETGHLSRMCPDNPRGIYPKGGGCKMCGSVEHKRANCPKGLKQKRKTQDMAGMVMDKTSADAEVFEEGLKDTTKRKTLKSKHKIIKF